MGYKIMEALELVLPLVKEMTGRDVQLSLCDRTTAIATWPAEGFSMPAAVPGIPLEWDNPAQREMLEVMERGVQSVSFLPKQVLGVPIRGILTPVFEGREVVGLVACAYSMEEDMKIQESIQQLNDNMTQSQDKIDEVAQEAINLADKLNSIWEVTEMVKKTVDKAADRVTTIQSNATRSNMLALNASIEAARAGEAGRGFAVVASEMGKLAQVSEDSSKEIRESLQEITDAVEKVESAVNEANQVAATQAESTGVVTTALADITKSVQEITEFVKK